MLRARLLRSWGSRLRGLLGTTRETGPVILFPCRSVHTYGMGYPIDVAFIGERGALLGVHRCVPPGRRLSSRGAIAVLERPYVPGAWIEPPDTLRLIAVLPNEEPSPGRMRLRDLADRRLRAGFVMRRKGST